MLYVWHLIHYKREDFLLIFTLQQAQCQNFGKVVNDNLITPLSDILHTRV